MSHPSELVLERFSVGDLPEERARKVEEHTRTCEQCARVLRELATAREALAKRMPPEAFVEKVSARRERVVRLAERRAARIGLGFVALVAAAAALLVVLRRPHSDEGGGVALKGSGVAVHRRRGEVVKVLASDDTIRGGDALRIVVTQARPSRVAAWFVDAQGRVDRVLDAGSIELAAGESPLPGSVVVDSPCVDLRLVVLFGADSFEDSERKMKEALARGSGLDDDAWAPPGALTERLRCE
jgi:hypothetical protein